MSTYRLTAVNAKGHGDTYGWGDTYEFDAESYQAAEENVLGRQGLEGQAPYTRIVSAWVKDDWRWVRLDPATGEPLS